MCIRDKTIIIIALVASLIGVGPSSLHLAKALDISDSIRFSLEFEEYRASMKVYQDGQGHFLAVTTLAENQDPLFWGKTTKYQQLRTWPSEKSTNEKRTLLFEDPRLGKEQTGLIEFHGIKDMTITCGEEKFSYTRTDRKTNRLIQRAAEFLPLPIEPRKVKYLYQIPSRKEPTYVALVTPRYADNDRKRFQVYYGVGKKLRETSIEELSVYFSAFGQDAQDGQITIKTKEGTLFVPGKADAKNKVRWDQETLQALVLTHELVHELGLHELQPDIKNLRTPCDPLFPQDEPRQVAKDAPSDL